MKHVKKFGKVNEEIGCEWSDEGPSYDAGRDLSHDILIKEINAIKKRLDNLEKNTVRRTGAGSVDTSGGKW